VSSVLPSATMYFWSTTAVKVSIRAVNFT